MSTTIEIDDALAKELECRALREGVSLTQLVEVVLRREVNGSPRAAPEPNAPFVQKTYDMGEPKIPIEKALSLAAEWEDEEIIRKMELGK